MSWLDRLNDIKFTIITGDGKKFTPLWKASEKTKEFNLTKYEFIDLEGSLVDRKKPKSGVYPLVFFFDGEDNIDKSNDFEESANDSRKWTITHPFYGEIKGHPVNLKRNDSNYNVTEISVDFWESISSESPLKSISYRDELTSNFNNLKSNSIDFLVENSNPSTSDINTIKNNLSISSAKFKPDSSSFNDFSSKVNSAKKSIDNIVTNSRVAYEDISEVISAPALFKDSVFKKINSYTEMYDVLKKNVNTLFEKYDFESQSSLIVASMCLCSINPLEDDYISKSDVQNVSDTISDVYNDYVGFIDTQQVSIYDVENSWSPNINIQQSLLSLVNFTLSSLNLISFEAKQERIYELKQNSNIILLTHRFMGLDSDDKNLELFRKINNIRNRELFELKKGRTIKYFV